MCEEYGQYEFLCVVVVSCNFRLRYIDNARCAQWRPAEFTVGAGGDL